MAALLGAIIYAINVNIPGIVASLFILIQAMLTELANHAYEFGEKGATILANFLNGIADNIGKVIDAATNVILNFLDGLPEMVQRSSTRVCGPFLSFLRASEMPLTSTLTDSTRLVERLLGPLSMV